MTAREVLWFEHRAQIAGKAGFAAAKNPVLWPFTQKSRPRFFVTAFLRMTRGD